MFWSIACSRSVVTRALKVALLVGCILVAINHGDALLAGDVDGIRLSKILLTFLVPYCVSVYSATAFSAEAGTAADAPVGDAGKHAG